ncbi:hypothetical protein TPELB_10240 [Terrisporobacter petrolearius]|uniref:Uncharacterized protein n=1 Tax=Terrisporobacter petrolearius TaxID=1460447 RepID=A0ABZ3FBI2_9FIRM
MNIIQHILIIDDKLENSNDKKFVDSLYDFDDSNDFGLNFSSNSVPWSQNTPWAMQQDFDHDGIPDALDNYFGMGAYNR